MTVKGQERKRWVRENTVPTPFPPNPTTILYSNQQQQYAPPILNQKLKKYPHICRLWKFTFIRHSEIQSS